MVGQLEEEPGALLFDRIRSTISLTQAGERHLEHARTLLRQVEEIKSEIRRLGEGAEGRLRIDDQAVHVRNFVRMAQTVARDHMTSQVAGLRASPFRMRDNPH